MGRKKLRESNPKAGEVEVGKAAVDRITARPTFEYFDRPTIGTEFFLFKEKGDSISGHVISRAIPNVRRNSSYAIRLDSGKIVEVFANNRQAVMRRIYPALGESRGVVLFSKGGSTKVPTAQAWEMMPSNPY